MQARQCAAAGRLPRGCVPPRPRARPPAAQAKGCRPCKLFARKYKTAAALYSDAVFLEIFGDETKDTRVRRAARCACAAVGAHTTRLLSRPSPHSPTSPTHPPARPPCCRS